MIRTNIITLYPEKGETPTPDDLVCMARRWEKIHSPKARVYVRYCDGRPDAIVETTDGHKPRAWNHQSGMLTYVCVEQFNHGGTQNFSLATQT